jgi:hypothetical protein
MVEPTPEAIERAKRTMMKVSDSPKGELGPLIVECQDGEVFEVDTRDHVTAIATVAQARHEEAEERRWRELYRPLYTSNDLADLVGAARVAKERARLAKAGKEILQSFLTTGAV